LLAAEEVPRKALHGPGVGENLRGIARRRSCAPSPGPRALHGPGVGVALTGVVTPHNTFSRISKHPNRPSTRKALEGIGKADGRGGDELVGVDVSPDLHARGFGRDGQEVHPPSYAKNAALAAAARILQGESYPSPLRSPARAQDPYQQAYIFITCIRLGHWIITYNHRAEVEDRMVQATIIWKVGNLVFFFMLVVLVGELLPKFIDAPLSYPHPCTSASSPTPPLPPRFSLAGASLNQRKFSNDATVVVMDNGCLCCTIKDDFADGVLSLLPLATGKELDGIIIETSGMADPAPVILAISKNNAIQSQARLDAVVCVVDAKHCIGRLDDETIPDGKRINEAFEQITFSDALLLNKVDMVSDSELLEVRDRIRSINSYARIIPTVKCNINLDEIINLRCHDLSHFEGQLKSAEDHETFLEEQHGHSHSHGHGHGHGDGGHGHGHGHEHGHGHGEGECEEKDCEDKSHDHGHGHGHAETEHGHGHGHEGHGHGHDHSKSKDRGLEDLDDKNRHDHEHKPEPLNRHGGKVHSFGLKKSGSMTDESFSHFLNRLSRISTTKGTILRIKAVLSVIGEQNKIAFHAVMDACDEDQLEEWKSEEERFAKLKI